MYTPYQMFAQQLNVAKGWFANVSLDKQAPVSANVNPTTYGSFVPGRCVSLDSTGGWVLGASGHTLGHFLLNSLLGSDVTNSGADPGGNVSWVAGIPTGIVTALPAVGAFELQTTEYDNTQTYHYNDLLISNASGVLTNSGVTQYVQNVVGIVTRSETYGTATFENSYGVNMLGFYPVYLPASSG